MKNTDKKLIFRLGEIRFFLDLGFVVEVVDSIEKRLDAGRSDIAKAIVSAFCFRQTWIPAVDPGLRFGLTSTVKIKDRIAVVLKGPEGNWAILVDQIEELSVADQLIYCEVPFLLKISALGRYSTLMLHNDQPCVGFDIEQFYDTVPESA